MIDLNFVNKKGGSYSDFNPVYPFYPFDHFDRLSNRGKRGNNITVAELSRSQSGFPSTGSGNEVTQNLVSLMLLSFFCSILVSVSLYQKLHLCVSTLQHRLTQLAVFSSYDLHPHHFDVAIIFSPYLLYCRYSNCRLNILVCICMLSYFSFHHFGFDPFYCFDRLSNRGEHYYNSVTELSRRVTTPHPKNCKIHV